MSDDVQPSSLELLEPDFHVASFFVPSSRRPAVLALMVFEVELARIATQVSEPMVAQIRYAWWREQVDAVFAGRQVFAPAVLGLRDAVAAHALPREPLDEMIDAHARDCDTVPFAGGRDFHAHGEATIGSLLKLMCRVLGAGSLADPACVAAGRAYGGARQLAGFAHWCHHRRLRLPLDVVLAQGLSEADVFADVSVRGKLLPVFAGIKTGLRDALNELNRSRFPRAAAPALALAALARPALAAAYDPLKPAAISPAQRALRLAGANLLWRF
jgi:phytoene/squalene synthetase